VVVDATGRPDRSPVTAADLAPWRDRFRPGAVVLVRTSVERYPSPSSVDDGARAGAGSPG
jgi:hypothetical protein